MTTSLSIQNFFDKYGIDSTNNFQLIHYAKELNIKPFKVLMCNELKKLKKLKSKECVYIICNYQSTSDSGSHWIAIYSKYSHSRTSFYFDSYGIHPFPEAEEFMEEGIYSTFKIQPEGSKVCGQLCLWVLYQLSLNKDFYDIVLELNNYFTNNKNG